MAFYEHDSPYDSDTDAVRGRGQSFKAMRKNEERHRPVRAPSDAWGEATSHQSRHTSRSSDVRSRSLDRRQFGLGELFSIPGAQNMSREGREYGTGSDQNRPAPREVRGYEHVSREGRETYQTQRGFCRPSGNRAQSVDRRESHSVRSNVQGRGAPNMYRQNAPTVNQRNVMRGAISRSHPRPLPQGDQVDRRHRNRFQDKDSWEICMRNVSDRRCYFGINCRRHHCNETYQWQYKDVMKDDDTWHNFHRETNSDIEVNYCQPDKGDCHIRFWRGIVVQIVYEKEPMYGEGPDTRLELRRLTTISSVAFTGPLSIWTTVWKWYWEDPYSGGWNEYGADDGFGSRSTLKSERLEQHYQENPETSVQFTTNNFDYILHFERMEQENVRISTVRRVRRRPVYFRKEEQMKRKFQSRFSSVIKPPLEWDVGTFRSEEELGGHYNLVKLLPPSSTYKRIEDLFNETMNGRKMIEKIEQIENGDLWMSYKQKQMQMTRKSKGKDVAEMNLFHGTQANLVEGICRQGFDFRFSGSSIGALYGRGSYFARAAKYSDCYAGRNSDGTKQLFVAKVLVGDYARGEKSYVRPPPRQADDPYDLYDSCVDDETNPKIFVIFTLEQIYPEYLITYR